MNYEAFVAGKSAITVPSGIHDPGELSPFLFPFQADLVRWALRRGRAAIFADTGLGKTRMQIEWALRVAAHTGGRVIILAPLAVASQTVAEGASLGAKVTLCRDTSDVADGINIANYDILHRFDPRMFSGVALDESSILKNFTGATRNALIEAFAATPFRCCFTATPAPNDFTELGNHAEFLGVMTRTEMLASYFVHDGGSTQDWRIKGHAVAAFWRWVCSWGALAKTPADLGYSDEGYILPALETTQTLIAAPDGAARSQGKLFAEAVKTLGEQRAARRSSLGDRVAFAASLAAAEPDEPWIFWCDLNDESKALAAAIPGAVEVTGSMTAEEKESALSRFSRGEATKLVSKSSICGFGMNWQHCARMAFVGVSHSYEAWYQAVRRCYRFGQKRAVRVHVVTSELEGEVLANLLRKEQDAIRLSGELRAYTAEMVRDNVRGQDRDRDTYDPQVDIKIPSWIRTEAT